MAVHYKTQLVSGVEIFYREAGDPSSPTLLLLHGFPTSSHVFRDLMPLLADQYRVVAPDYPGFGYSARPTPAQFEYTFDHVAELMQQFVDAIGLKKYSLYLQDFGGPVGFRMAAHRPGRVRGLIIQNANAYEEGVSEGVRNVVLRAYRERTPETESGLRALFELPATKRQYLEGVPDPSLVSPIVWGRGDFVFIPAGAKAYSKDLKNVELHMLDAGHFALETHAAEIARYIKEFRGAQD